MPAYSTARLLLSIKGKLSGRHLRDFSMFGFFGFFGFFTRGQTFSWWAYTKKKEKLT